MSSIVISKIYYKKNFLILIFYGAVKICEGTVCLKMVDITAIFGQIFLILILDQFSQPRMMRLERANLRKVIAKLYEPFF